MDRQKVTDAVALVLGAAGLGAITYVTLKATAVIPAERGEGASLIVDTFTLGSTKTDFIRGIMSAAAQVDPSLSPTSRLLLASWGALESGWGKTKQAKQGFNIWNVSASKAWLEAKKPVLPGGDTEYVPGSTTAKKVSQLWRQYDSLPAAVENLLTLLKTSSFINYREAYTDLVAGNPQFATRLGVFDRDANGVVRRVDTRANTAGFYTLPRSEYQKHVSNLYRDAQVLISTADISGLMAGTQS